MDPVLALLGSIVAAVVAVGGSIAVALISGRNNRKINETTARKVETDAEAARFDSQLVFQKYIDEQVKAAVKEALIEPNRIIAELREGIVDDKKLLVAMTENVANIKRVVRDYMQRLLKWNERGMVGPMPMPIAEEVDTLEIEDILPKVEEKSETLEDTR